MLDWMTAAAISLAMVQPQSATPPAQDPAAQEPTTLEDVVIEGVRLRDLVRDFVGEVAAPAGDRGPARWNGPVCIGVVNLRSEAAQYIVDRTSDVARELGLNAGEPGCRPNVLIVAVTDGRAVADAIVEARPRAFNPGGSGMTRSRRALATFRTSEAPIRWWHVSAPIDSETGDLATRLPGEAPPVIAISRASRLRTDIRDDLLKAIIIVDMDKVTGLSFPQLADYCALVALSQVDPEANVAAFDTVLNVFSDPATPGLTSWDMDYLNALYSAEQNSVGANARGAEIVDLMLNGARTAEPAADAD
jgi:hypothetical protein